MKAVRTYHVAGGNVECVVDFVPDYEDLEPEPLFPSTTYNSIFIRFAFSGVKRSSPKSPIPLRLVVRADPEVSRILVISEVSRFLETLKTMYEL